MRPGVSSMQHTLTAEAASVLKQAVSEAYKRGHAQANPLHVAATLLVSPSSPLRRACLQTQPHPSQLPQCRALELCFNIALDRLQAAQGPLPHGQPSYSNALVAALKRAQAHQRRGCPEQQQQPLLAVKVELEQLAISILDDPSVSRVMREAGFSSIDVKSHLEEMVSLIASHHSVKHGIMDSVRLPLGSYAAEKIGFRLGAVPPSIFGGLPLPHLTHFSSNLVYQEMNDLQFYRKQQNHICPTPIRPDISVQTASGGGESKQIVDVLSRKTMRNPVLLGDSAVRVEGVLRDVIQLMERGNVSERLQGVKVISANMSNNSLSNSTKEDLQLRFAELNRTMRELILGGGVVVNVGNLQWLLQVRASASQLTGFCPVQYAVHEINKLFTHYRNSGRIWLIGSATSQAYRSCLSRYPVLFSQWDLHPVSVGESETPILSAARCGPQDAGADNLALSLCPSAGSTLQLNSLCEGGGEKLSCCLECRNNYHKEVLLLRGQDGCKKSESPVSCSSLAEAPSKTTGNQGRSSTGESQPALPLWLQKALPDGRERAVIPSIEVYNKPVPLVTRMQELQCKWNQTCKAKHLSFDCALERRAPLELGQPPCPSLSQDRTLSLLRENTSQSATVKQTASNISAMNDHLTSRSFAPTLDVSSMQNCISKQLLQLGAHKDQLQEIPNSCRPLPAASVAIRCSEADVPCSISGGAHYGQPSLIQLCKGLAKKVGWQPRIISTIASTVLRCRSGVGRGGGGGLSFKGDTWLLFLGYDKPGKKLMAEALAELCFGEQKRPVCLAFGNKLQDMSSPATWSLGLGPPSRGKVPLDQFADAVRNNPSSLFYLEDVEAADSMLRSNLLQAITNGRLVDSSGRDVSLSGAIIVMTSSAGTDALDSICTLSDNQDSKENLVSVDEESRRFDRWFVGKRRAIWEADEDVKREDEGSCRKRANIGQALDLNLSLAVEENEKAGFPGSLSPVLDSCNGLGVKGPEVSDEEVHLGAHKQLGKLCDLVDAAVVFDPRS